MQKRLNFLQKAVAYSSCLTTPTPYLSADIIKLIKVRDLNNLLASSPLTLVKHPRAVAAHIPRDFDDLNFSVEFFNSIIDQSASTSYTPVGPTDVQHLISNVIAKWSGVKGPFSISANEEFVNFSKSLQDVEDLIPADLPTSWNTFTETSILCFMLDEFSADVQGTIGNYTGENHINDLVDGKPQSLLIQGLLERIAGDEAASNDYDLVASPLYRNSLAFHTYRRVQGTTVIPFDVNTEVVEKLSAQIGDTMEYLAENAVGLNHFYDWVMAMDMADITNGSNFGASTTEDLYKMILSLLVRLTEVEIDTFDNMVHMAYKLESGIEELLVESE